MSNAAGSPRDAASVLFNLPEHRVVEAVDLPAGLVTPDRGPRPHRRHHRSNRSREQRNQEHQADRTRLPQPRPLQARILLASAAPDGSVNIRTSARSRQTAKSPFGGDVPDE